MVRLQDVKQVVCKSKTLFSSVFITTSNNKSMNHHHHHLLHNFSSALACLLLTFLLTASSCAASNQGYNNHTACLVPYKCGKFTDISYPFWGNHRPQQCGHPKLKLNCENNTTTTIQIDNVTHTVLDVNQETHVLKIARTDLSKSLCTQQLRNASLDPSLLEYAFGYSNLTLTYGCMYTSLPVPYIFDCPVEGLSERTSYVDIGSSLLGVNFFAGVYSCHVSVVVPVSFHTVIEGLKDAAELVGKGFEVGFKAGFHGLCGKCENSGGRCGYDDGGEEFVCFCANGGTAARGEKCEGGDVAAHRVGGGGSSTVSARVGKKSNSGRKIGLFIGGALLAGIVLGWLIFYARQKRKQSSLITKSVVKEIIPSPRSIKRVSTPLSDSFTKSIPSYPSSNSDIISKVTSYRGVKVFTYTELEEATDNFDPCKELGDGAFGTVYYGVLNDGRVVAVKRLYENNFKRVEQFMNEVEILNNLRHQNLVQLYGCTSKKSRELLLVYEYVPNGTVGDHLHGKRADLGLLSWPIRLNIAIETADALTYLHKSGIIHRDVKTNNILLDSDFHVKVADFGLSRLFPKDFTHVSTAPQGTPGYVDPEYFQCYQLTEKSDVYSFGVVLIELISSLQAVDTSRHRRDINLSNMAVNKIQNRALHEMVDSSIGFETNSSVRRVVSLVAELAFRCLQQERDMRPSMPEVLEALRGMKNEDSSARNVEIVDILVDHDGDDDEDAAVLLKGSVEPPSPDSQGNE